MKRNLLKILSSILIITFLFGMNIQAAFSKEINVPKDFVIFYLNGDWEYQPVSLKIDTDNPYLSALNLLVTGYNIPEGCYREFPEGVKINSFTLQGNTANADINKLLIDKMNELNLSTDILRDILSYNIFNFDSKIEKVTFTFDGNTVDYFSNISRQDYFKVDSQDLDKQVKDKIKALTEQFKGKTPEQIREIIKKSAKERTKDASDISATADTYKVCVDPGHGGTDPGSSGKLNNVTYYEKNINLGIALWLKKYLESDGITVYITRTTDKTVSYSARYTLANNNAVDCFVSVHNNSNIKTTPRGTTAIYPNNHDITESSNLASEVHSAILSFTSLPEHRIPYKADRELAVLKYTKMPAIITETGFMSNTTDLSYLIKSSNQEAIGSAIEMGIYWWLYY